MYSISLRYCCGAASGLVLLVLAPLVVAGDIPVATWSADIHQLRASTLVRDEDVAQGSGAMVSLANLGILPPAADVDGFHHLENGDVLFSLDISVTLDGALYRPCDVIRYNGASWSREFDCIQRGIPAGVNVDAVAMAEGTLVISTDIAVQLGGQYYDDADIIAVGNDSFSLYFDSADAGVPSAADVDAVHVDNADRILLSFDTTQAIGGVTFADEDMAARESPTWSMEFDGSASDGSWLAADLDAWSFAFIADLLFKDGFEE